MILEVSCNDVGILPILKVIKNLFDLIQIIAPIVAIISLGIILTKIVTSTDINNIDKLKKKFKNALLALAIVFLIPSLVNLSMTIVGNKFVVSECWNSIDKVSLNSKSVYIEKNDFIDKNNDGKDDSTGKKKVSVYTSEKDYYNKVTSNNTGLGDGPITQITSCGSLEYCNKYLTSLYNNSKKLNDAIVNNHASVIYSNSGDPKSWAQAINVAKKGNTVKISCNRPSHWSMRDITGEYRDFWSRGKGGFVNYKGPMTKYTKQIVLNGNSSLKSLIKKGYIQNGDIIGVSGHTFSIYSMDKSTGSAVVVDGGHKFTGKCQKNKKCSTMFTYSAKTNEHYKVYQIIRWVK